MNAPSTGFTRLLIAALATVATPLDARPFSELVVFGDSYSDTGNFWYRDPHILPSPPYDEGRFSNGSVWVERLAERMQLPAPRSSERYGGTGYAWGGATTGSVPYNVAENMDRQVHECLADNALGPAQLFTLYGGHNDLAAGAEPAAVVEMIAANLSTLAAHGGRTFLVFNLSSHHIPGKRALVSEFNALLPQKLDELRRTNSGTSIIEFDYAGLVDSIVEDPAAFGFVGVTQQDRACRDCRIGAPSKTSCDIVQDPDKYFFWDSVHPTAHAHQIIGDAAFDAVVAELDLLLAGDADMDRHFDQLDLVQVQTAARYLTGEPATWGEGDWNGAPGGAPGSPPEGDGVFNQLDIVAAQAASLYRAGPYKARQPSSPLSGVELSVGYDAATGGVRLETPSDIELTDVKLVYVSVPEPSGLLLAIIAGFISVVSAAASRLGPARSVRTAAKGICD